MAFSTRVQVENVTGESLSVATDPVAIEDTVLATLTPIVDAGSRTLVVANMTDEAVLEIITVSAAIKTTTGDVYALSFYTQSTGGILIGKFYFTQTLQINPNIRYTVQGFPDQDDDFYVQVTNESASTSETAYVSITYKITEP